MLFFILLPLVLTVPGGPSIHAQAEDSPKALFIKEVFVPGMVLIKGGSTKIGWSIKEVQRMTADNEPLQRYVGALSTATPEHTVKVDDFHMMVNEVTNEQYRAYVQATGAKPPQHWGEEAINQAQQLFLNEQGRIRQEAKEKGEPIPERREFDRGKWWKGSWKGQTWEIPEGSLHRPVVFVDYNEAQGFARWAGFRLPTEFEYVRAVRGNTNRMYPWGDEWDDEKYCATSALRGLNQAFPVGSFPEGKSEDGLYDLAGNVWEWTSSPFSRFPKWKMPTYTFGRGNQKRKVGPLVGKWDANNRVVVGGAFQENSFATMFAIRRNTERIQSTNAMGFRCAASKISGFDIAETVMRDELPTEHRPMDVDGAVEYAPELVIAMDRWDTTAPEVEAASDKGIRNAQSTPSRGPVQIPPPGYAVTTGYDYALFTPVFKVYGAQKSDLEKRTLTTGPVHIGFFSTDQAMLQPALEPGTYMVAYRAAGETKIDRSKKEKEEKPAEEEKVGFRQDPADPDAADPEDPEEEAAEPLLEEKLGFDINVPQFIIYNGKGEPLLAIPSSGIEYKNLKPGGITNFDKTVKETIGEGEEAQEIERIEKWIKFTICIPGRSPRKGFFFELPIQFEPGLFEKSWRR